MIVVVAFNFRAVDRDQRFLMPPSMADWLSEDHLGWFVIDVVDELDLAAFDEAYRHDGRGAAVYAPASFEGRFTDTRLTFFTHRLSLGGAVGDVGQVPGSDLVPPPHDGAAELADLGRAGLVL